MESEKSQIQNPWKRDWLILGIATLIVPITFLLRLPFGPEHSPVPLAFMLADTLYFSVAAFDMGRLRINIILRVLIISLFFPITKLLVILTCNQDCYPLHI